MLFQTTHSNNGIAMKKSFILHLDSLVILDEMTDEQAGKFLKTLYYYKKTNQLLELDFAMKMAITPFINQFKRDDESYKKTCEQRRIAGAMGGKQKVANASKCKQTVANLADNDNDNDSDNKNDKEELLVIPKRNHAVEMINIWNEVCRSLPKATLYAENRNKKLNYLIGNKNLKDDKGKPMFEDMEDWRYYCEIVEASDFLAREWGKCNIDWVLKPANMIKIYEGNYGNKK